MIDETVTRRIVTEFLTHVRSGRDLNHVEDARITQYWMQIDRAGLAAQLAEVPETTNPPS